MVHPINDEFKEKYRKVKEIVEDEFPKEKRHIEIISWDDGTFRIQGAYAREKHRCHVVIGSEEASASSEITHQVLYKDGRYVFAEEGSVGELKEDIL